MIDIVVHRVASFRIDPQVLRRDGHRFVLVSTPGKRDYLDRSQAGRAFDETVVIDDDFDADQLAATVLAVMGTVAPDEVNLLCHDEYALGVVAEVRERLGLRGPRPHQIAPFLDKMAMKAAVESAGLRVPRHVLFSRQRYVAAGPDYLREITSRIGFPAFAKPTGESGSVGATRLDTPGRLAAWADQVATHPATGNTTEFEIDEFVDGTLYHVDTLLKDGRIVHVRCNRYVFPCADYAAGRVCATYTLDEQEPVHHALVEFNERVLAAFPAKPASGAMHHEVFVTDAGELVFLEIAARAPAALAPATGRIRWGVDIEETHFRLQRGEDVPARHGTQGPFAGFVYYPKVDGVASGINQPSIDSSMVWMPNVTVGQQMSAPTDIRDFAGAALIWNPNYRDLVRDMHLLAQFQPLDTADRVPRVA